MRYCMYLRKSRVDLEAEARGEGETLARHEKILLEFAQKHNLPVQKQYREIVSGETIAARPVMQELLAAVEAGLWDGVIVLEVERLARGDTIDQGIVAQTFKFSHTKIITPNKIYDPNDEFDEEYFEFGLFMSRREYKVINRRLQRGRLAAIKEGKYVANQPPYGYVRRKIEGDKGFTLEPMEEQAQAVRTIFEYYTTGECQPDGTHQPLGISLIAKRLNAMHLPAQRGGMWSASSIREILSNPVYIGKVRWNFRPTVKKIVDGKIRQVRPRAEEEHCLIADGLHPPIIAAEVFEAAQTRLKKKRARAPIADQREMKNPLCGLVVCAKCGRKMVRRGWRDSDRPDTLLCPNPNCDTVSAALHLVERAVVEALERWLCGYRICWEHACRGSSGEEQTDAANKSIRRIQAQMAVLERQIDQQYDLLEQGIYTPDVFAQRRAHLQERLVQLKCDRELLLNRCTVRPKKPKLPDVSDIMALYRMLPNAKAKNELLHQVVEKIEYKKEHGGRWHRAPDAFHLRLYPRLPRLPQG